MQINWKLIIGKYLKVLLSSFIAGLLIGIAVTISFIIQSTTLVNANIIGPLFGVLGVLLICLYGYNLYTFKVGYVFENKVDYLIEVILSLVGNIIGVFLMSLMLRATSLMSDGSEFLNVVNSYMSSRVEEDFFSMIILSFIGGIVAYFGYNTYKKAEQPIAKFLTLILCVGAIYICGLKEGITDMFIYSVYKLFDGALALKIFYIILGNTFGALLIPLLNKLRSKIKSM